jgi:hypothetical protein
MESPSPIPALEEIASRMSSDFVSALAMAYAIGRADMKRELMALLSPLGAGADSPSTPRHSSASIARPSAKAPPGTVKPAILRMLDDSALSTEQIIRITGFKENSVRGTLSTLLKAGEIERNGGYWKKKAPISEPMGAP